MERVGILVVSYGSREVAIADAFARSLKYRAEIYVADKQCNPSNLRLATKHVVIPDLEIGEVCKFAEANKNRIDFGIVGPERPIIEGIRDLVEKRTGIPMICPTKEYAIEGSKVRQRLLFQEIVPSLNPRFKIFNPNEFTSREKARKSVNAWLDELGDKAVVKPDKPAAGKGVGVWGDHFVNREQLFEHFLSNFQFGSVLIEEKVEGEESSFQAFCDGKHVVPLPDTRDYKRAFDDDKGPNTGGMGSYKNCGEILPFLTKVDRAREIDAASKVFEKWRKNDKVGLRGIPLYMAFMHTKDEPKLLENNSRPGDPEIMNILPILKDELVDVCFKILEGNLTRIEVEKAATVVTYKVPPAYGGHDEALPKALNKGETGTPVDLAKALKLCKKFGDKMRVYPGSMELRARENYAMKSRTVAVVGVGEEIEKAREISLEGINAIKGGGLWCRMDIASERHIKSSTTHMKNLRKTL